jgi:hypothetical protein
MLRYLTVLTFLSSSGLQAALPSLFLLCPSPSFLICPSDVSASGVERTSRSSMKRMSPRTEARMLTHMSSTDMSPSLFYLRSIETFS